MICGFMVSKLCTEIKFKRSVFPMNTFFSISYRWAIWYFHTKQTGIFSSSLMKSDIKPLERSLLNQASNLPSNSKMLPKAWKLRHCSLHPPGIRSKQVSLSCSKKRTKSDSRKKIKPKWISSEDQRLSLPSVPGLFFSEQIRQTPVRNGAI